MEKIEINEYIRTKDGVIAKVTATGYGIDCDRDVFDLKCLQMMEIPPEHVQEYVIKHSFNIIDLIEVGDYVNGNKVVKQVSEEDKEPYLVVVVSSKMIKEPLFDYITNNRIKSIVTKEMFQNIEYRVENN